MIGLQTGGVFLTSDCSSTSFSVSLGEDMEETDLKSLTASKSSISLALQARERKDEDTLVSQIELILKDRREYGRLLAQRGELAQSLLDLLQTLHDSPNVLPMLRSKILSAMIRLSRKSGLYPNCLVLNNVTKVGNHPVAAGGFGEIWQGVIGNQMACLKVVKIYGDSDIYQLLKEFFQEAIVWRQLEHPNVLPFLGLYFLDGSRQRVCLLSPWMDNGNLRQFLKDRSLQSIDHARLAYDIARGLCYLHEEKIIHGDLKGDNVLITRAGRAAIADFGLARKVAESDILRLTSLSTSNHGKGSTRWMAPECLIPPISHPSFRSDVYAFGGVCYEVFTGCVPFYELPQDASVILQLSAGRRPSRRADIPRLNDATWSIMQECWSQDPFTRPEASALPSMVAHASNRVIETADNWDRLLPSQLYEAVQRPELCPSGSRLESFLFDSRPLVTNITQHVSSANAGSHPFDSAAQLKTAVTGQTLTRLRSRTSERQSTDPALLSPSIRDCADIPHQSDQTSITNESSTPLSDYFTLDPPNVISSVRDLKPNISTDDAAAREAKRRWFVSALIDGELSYVQDLEAIENMYIRPLRNSAPPIIPLDRLESFMGDVFHNVADLCTFHCRLLQKLQKIYKQSICREGQFTARSTIAAVFDAVLSSRAIYKQYIYNRPISTYRIEEECANNWRFKTFLEINVGQSDVRFQDIDGFINRPVYRLIYYRTFFENVLGTLIDHEDRKGLLQIVEDIKALEKHIGRDVISMENRVALWEYNSKFLFQQVGWTDIGLMDANRRLVHSGKLFKSDLPGVSFERNTSEIRELFVLLLDNYLVISEVKSQLEQTKYYVDRRPVHIDLLSLVDFTDHPRQLGAHNSSGVESEPDPHLLYPFIIQRSGQKGGQHILYAESAEVRAEWKMKLEDALRLRRLTPENRMFKIESKCLIPSGKRTNLAWTWFHDRLMAKATCAVPFSTPRGQHLVVIGCADGVWLRFGDLESMRMRRILTLKKVTQCAVLEDYGVLLVLGNKKLYAYQIEALIPSSSESKRTTPTFEKLSRCDEVQFFDVGMSHGRTFVVYMKKKRGHNIFCVMEPIHKERPEGPATSTSPRFNICHTKSNLFRSFKEFHIMPEPYDLMFVKDKIVILCARGFKIMDLMNLQSEMIPRQENPCYAQLVNRWEFAKPLGMFQLTNEEFLLCFTEFGIYANQHGDPSRPTVAIEWEGTAKRVAFHNPYILLFDPCFIEVRHLHTGNLVQIIPGNDVSCLWNGRGVTLSTTATGKISREARVYGVMTEIGWASGMPFQRLFELVPKMPLDSS